MNTQRIAVAPAVLALLSVTLVTTPQAHAVTYSLGSAANFAMFADGTGTSQTGSITLFKYAVNGNVGAPTVSETGNSSVSGTITAGTNNPTLMQAQTDATTFGTQISGLAPTQTISGISSSTTIAGNGGNNVIDVNGSITSAFKVSGGANDVFIFNVTGTLNVTSGIVADITGSGVTANHIIFNFIGTTANTQVTEGNNATIDGTLLSTNGDYHYLLNGVNNGAAIDLFNGTAIDTSGGNGNGTQNGSNVFTGVSVPEPSQYILTSIVCGLGGVGYMWRRKQAMA